jgi:hypothetical protein
MFDNGSGMVEVSSGKRLKIEGFGEVNCDEVWGDFGWPHANDMIDRVSPLETHTYRIEWQRLNQRWYIDGILVYERQLALNEPLPLMIWNEGSGNINIESIRVTSLYVSGVAGR